MRADHKRVLRQLKTAKGQLEGIMKMVEEDRYCIDISNQLLATRAIIDKINAIIIAGHLEGCVVEAVETKDEASKKEKMEELEKLIQKVMKI